MMAQKTGVSARNLCDTYGFGTPRDFSAAGDWWTIG